jgi:hypothetical protein
MRQGLIIGCACLSLVLAAGAGFWVGVREGWDLALMENAVHIGMAALPRVEAVRSGRTAELNKAFEFDIDSALVWSHYFLESPLSGFLAPIWGIAATAQQRLDVVRLANHRRTYPSPTKADALDDVSPQTFTPRGVDHQLTAIDERLAIINDMVRQYAKEP